MSNARNVAHIKQLYSLFSAGGNIFCTPLFRIICGLDFSRASSKILQKAALAHAPNYQDLISLNIGSPYFSKKSESLKST